MTRMRTESDEVLYATENTFFLDRTTLDELTRRALGNPRKRIRICCHHHPDNPVHEMVIVHTCDTYVRPHRHVGKTESFSVLKGEVDVVLFDDEGGVTQIVRMGAPDTGLPFYYRIAAPIYHTLLIRSEVLVFHEVTQGPFLRERTLFPDWAKADFDISPFREAEATFVVEQMKNPSSRL